MKMLTLSNAKWVMIVGLLLYILFFQECYRPSCPECPECPPNKGSVILDPGTDLDTAEIIYEEQGVVPPTTKIMNKKVVTPVDTPTIPLDTTEIVYDEPRDSMLENSDEPELFSRTLAVSPTSPRIYQGSAVTEQGIVNYYHEVEGRLIKSRYSILPKVPASILEPEIIEKPFHYSKLVGFVGIDVPIDAQATGNQFDITTSLIYIPGKKNRMSIGASYGLIQRRVGVQVGWSIMRWRSKP